LSVLALLVTVLITIGSMITIADFSTEDNHLCFLTVFDQSWYHSTVLIACSIVLMLTSILFILPVL
jgi:hypothetical protein